MNTKIDFISYSLCIWQ